MKKSEPNQILLALEAAAFDEHAAIVFFENARWGETPKCPCCGATDVYAMKDATGTDREKNHRWRCHKCKERYSVRTGSIFEETRLPMKVWAHAMWRVCASKKGVSALQISRETQISYKSALYLLHRIRHAMADGGTFEPLGGDGKDVEADETYVGGKPRFKGWKKAAGLTGRGTDKIPVMVMVERGGNAKLRVMKRVTALDLGKQLVANVDGETRLITDDFGAYRLIGKHFEGGHETVNHSKRQYAKAGGIHSNTAESVFSLLKRGLMGTFHSVSPEHLHRYLAEFSFRWNQRFVDDGTRTVAAVRAAEGKRLMYRAANPQKEAG